MGGGEGRETGEAKSCDSCGLSPQRRAHINELRAKEAKALSEEDYDLGMFPHARVHSAE